MKPISMAALLLMNWMATVGYGREIAYQFYWLASRTDCEDAVSIWGINDLGEVVGADTYPNCSQAYAFVWVNGGYFNFDREYDEGELQAAVSISEGGVVLMDGYFDDGGYLTIDVFSWHEGEVSVMSVLSECQLEGNDYPKAISSNGAWAAGACWADSYATSFPLVYRIADSSPINLGRLPDLPEPSHSTTYDVNDAGVAVGEECILDGCHAFVWIDGVLSEIESQFGGEHAHSRAINNKNVVAGMAQKANGEYVAMSYDLGSGVMVELGPGVTQGMNDRGQIVGYDIIDISTVHPYLYENGMINDLQPYLPVGWRGADCEGINNYGWVIGDAEDETEDSVAWLLVPIYPKGDYDGDSDVDLHDFGHFQRCFAAEPYQGPEGGLHVGCSVFDFDDDVDLDLTDYDAFQAAFTGAITSGW